MAARQFQLGVSARWALGASALAILALSGCSPSDAPLTATEAPGISVPFEKFTLDNGLQVVLHVDKSDPVVAINLAAHVGSARELPGRTGFAHLFEHLLFLDSENLGYGGLDEMNTRIGGEGTNGFTTSDMTQYFQAVPADALEKVIWAEADKLGYFINTVSQAVIDNEKQVVKNEKRQRVDNQAYGHNFDVIGKALYPADHPYSWQVIGSLADLQAATLEDTRQFYRRWYVPNNVTVTIAGDFDPALAKTLVEKYFGEIPRGEDAPKSAPKPVTLAQSISLMHEDNFATVPQLTMVWPTVEEYHPDSYALNILAQYLTDGKRAPLNEVLIDEEKLTSNVAMFAFEKELASEMLLIVRANAGADLDAFPAALATAFARFETNGIAQADLDRIKAGLEVQFYGEIESALGKAIQLSEYNIFTGDPGFLRRDLAALQGVTIEDVRRVYDTYIKNKPFISTSFVPKGAPQLAIEGAVPANIVEEPIIAGADAPVQFDPTVRNFERTPSAFDRTKEPDFGAPYTLATPQVWRAAFSNGVGVVGLESRETPLVTFSLKIDAGRRRGDATKPAIAALTADLMNKGTANRTTAELEDAIKALGSELSISADADGAYVSGTTLARNFNATIALVQEMLTQPRWDAEEFDLLKRRQLTNLDQAEANPNFLAAREAAKLAYPADHVLHYVGYGAKDKLEAVTLDDLKAFYAAHYRPGGAQLRIVGAVNQSAVTAAFAGLVETWSGAATPAPTLAPPAEIAQSKVYFYDVPDAKQSVLRIVRPALPATAADYPLARAVNFLLGDIYTSRLNTELRVNRGYTYGIGSSFNGSSDRGEFLIGSSVRTNVTLESLQLIREIVSAYGPSFSEADLATLKSALLRGQALQTETLGAKLGLLQDISDFGYPDDFRARNATAIQALTLDGVKRLAADYLRPDAMNWVVVGDAKTQRARLADLGFGEPVALNK